MEKLMELVQDVVVLWSKYYPMYLSGIKNTIILAVVATVIGCGIGLVCGILNTIPYSKNASAPKRFVLKLVRAVVRVYVEVFRGTPMVLQAVFIYYGLPYFTDGQVSFSGTDGDFQFATEEERAENVNIGISVQKGNTALKDAINTVLSAMTEDDFNALMDQAIAIQPEV